MKALAIALRIAAIRPLDGLQPGRITMLRDQELCATIDIERGWHDVSLPQAVARSSVGGTIRRGKHDERFRGHG